MFDFIVSVLFYVSIISLVAYCIYIAIKKIRNKRKNKEVKNDLDN